MKISPCGDRESFHYIEKRDHVIIHEIVVGLHLGVRVVFSIVLKSDKIHIKIYIGGA